MKIITISYPSGKSTIYGQEELVDNYNIALKIKERIEKNIKENESSIVLLPFSFILARHGGQLVKEEWKMESISLDIDSSEEAKKGDGIEFIVKEA